MKPIIFAIAFTFCIGIAMAESPKPKNEVKLFCTAWVYGHQRLAAKHGENILVWDIEHRITRCVVLWKKVIQNTKDKK